ncbi:MAG: hypothetical protein ACK4PR_10330 [Gammaproteobacteria bacterium]
MFRKPLNTIFVSVSKLWDRTKNFQLDVNTFKISLGSDMPIPEGINTINTERGNSFKDYQSIIITNEENIIKNQLEKAGYNSKEAINILINQLANKNLHIKLLVINSFIDIEQIKALSSINHCGKPSTEEDLKQYYENCKARLNATEMTFDQFMFFLLQQGLVTQEFMGYRCTMMGKEYLTFIVRIGRII